VERGDLLAERAVGPFLSSVWFLPVDLHRTPNRPSARAPSLAPTEGQGYNAGGADLGTVRNFLNVVRDATSMPPIGSVARLLVFRA
jgi:hypothetical protein